MMEGTEITTCYLIHDVKKVIIKMMKYEIMI